MSELLPDMAADKAVSSTAAVPTTIERISAFVEKNKKACAIAAGASVVVAGGITYYILTQRPTSKDDGSNLESGSSKKKLKKSKKSKSSKRASPTSATTSSDEKPSVLSTSTSTSAKVEEISTDDPLKMAKNELDALSTERRKTIAGQLKTRGNKLFSNKDFQEAIKYYTKAIECEEQAVFYSNRAACYTSLKQTDNVIQDCTDALRLDKTYIKALNRRGQALEARAKDGDLFDALCDYTAAAILEGFKNKQATDSVDRVMKRASEEGAATIIKNREPRLPSVMFIRAYMEAFRSKPLPEIPNDAPQGDQTLLLALNANTANNYAHAMTLVEEALAQGISSDALKARAYNLRGTFRFIMGNANLAIEDLDKATELDRNFTQTWVKKASVHMELAQPDDAFRDFDTAEAINPTDPDVYYHRGQVYFILGRFADAITQYRKSTELDGNFIYSQIQHAVALYKEGKKEKADAKFRKLMKNFADSPEIYNYYGELQLDQANADASYFAKAVSNFDKAIELEQKKEGYTSVLPMINKALAVFQEDKSRIEDAEELCRQALAKDPLCDVGIATLAQLYVQQNKIHQAVEMFERSVELSRTEPELTHMLQYLNATKAQIDFVEKYPEEAASLGVAAVSPAVQ